jgi:DNA replication ATP-dependent helicase Dna2
MLSVKDEKTGMLKIILLRQAWLDSRCTKGSYVHLIGDFDHLGQCIVDDHENMIILHPDHLISATVVADSFSCTRRAVLQDRIKATGAAEPSQVYGHILHEIFGQALKANDWSLESLRVIIERILCNWIESLYEINTQVPQALDYLLSKMPELQAWASIFVNAHPSPQGEVRDRNGGISNMNVNKLLEVEEHIWSPMFGLKGNVDATIQITLQEPHDSQTQTLTVPLEFKTGKKDNNEMHRAQTALYTLLLSDRYDINVTSGVLYYLETSRTFRVQAIRNEIRHMIIQRNELACYVRNKLELPPLIKKPFLCNHCYAQTACFTYHKLVDGGNGETSGLKEKFEEAVSHLKPVHQAFFQKWDELLTKEERDAMKFRRELWTMLSEEREVLGRCFGRVYIEPESALESPDGPKINRYQYTFLKQAPKPGFSFTESQLTVGEPIVVSDEEGHFALANGYITKVRPTRLTVAVDRKLHQIREKCAGFDPETKQVFNGIMEVENHTSPSTASPPSENESTNLFRVDKDEFSNGMATVRNNLIRIMEKDLFKARELRQLIVEGAAPSFKASSSAYTVTGPSSQQSLNVDQVHAINKVMSAKDYALVLGMPGTGKTTTIAHIIRALVSQGKSVLLTSYTHTAVDNILLKIKDDDIPILRLGAVAKVHPEVQTFADLAGIPKKTIAELENSYVHSKVVASTCLGVNHPIFNSRIFDYCIVDEASQITLPTCLGPIRMAKTFILVGDHFQLPPLVQNKEAQEGGLDISLFKMLSDNQPDSVVNLEHQYRMAEDIMLLSNTLIYNGRLKCGTPSIANRTLSIPNLEAGLASHHHKSNSLPSPKTSSLCLQPSTCWLRCALIPQSRCLFLNTDPLLPHSRDIVSGSRITNPLEATLTTQLVHTLLSTGIPARSIGIITFYRSQLALLRQTLAKIPDLEMHTADKFQGRDKDVVILSCVRSNEARGIGDLLRDWRRVNVAVTRAKSKLLILGSSGTLGGCGNETLEGLVRLMERKGWVLDLPRAAGEGHVFEGGMFGTQTQTQAQVEVTAADKRKSPKKKRPMTVDTDVLSPTKKRKANPNPNPPFKRPAKVINGSLAQAERVLGRSGVMQDIVNGIS